MSTQAETSAVLSPQDFIEVCRVAKETGTFILRVDLVGPAGYRVVRLMPRVAKKRVSPSQHTARQLLLAV